MFEPAPELDHGGREVTDEHVGQVVSEPGILPEVEMPPGALADPLAAFDRHTPEDSDTEASTSEPDKRTWEDSLFTLVGHLAAPVVELGRGFEHYRVHGITRRRSLLVARRATRDDPGVDEATAVARPQPLHAPEHPGCAPRLTWQSGLHLRRAAVNAPRGPR